MLYELITVVRPSAVKEIKEVARAIGTHLVTRGGVVRGITNWGFFHLAGGGATGRHGNEKFHAGHYFVMRFDCAARDQHGVQRLLALEPRLLRYSLVRLGGDGGLRGVSDVGGEAEEWKGRSGARGEEPVQKRARDDYFIG